MNMWPRRNSTRPSLWNSSTVFAPDPAVPGDAPGRGPAAGCVAVPGAQRGDQRNAPTPSPRPNRTDPSSETAEFPSTSESAPTQGPSVASSHRQHLLIGANDLRGAFLGKGQIAGIVGSHAAAAPACNRGQGWFLDAEP